MDLTPLETVLGGTVLSGVVGLVTWVVTASRYQTKDACSTIHGAMCQRVTDVERTQEVDTKAQKRMLTEIVMHLPIEDEHKVRIINGDQK